MPNDGGRRAAQAAPGQFAFRERFRHNGVRFHGLRPASQLEMAHERLEIVNRAHGGLRGLRQAGRPT
jgi:hypothetical protein